MFAGQSTQPRKCIASARAPESPPASPPPRAASDSAPTPARTATLPPRPKLAQRIRRPAQPAELFPQHLYRHRPIPRRPQRTPPKSPVTRISGRASSDHPARNTAPSRATTRTRTRCVCTGAVASVNGRAACITVGDRSFSTRRSPTRTRSNRIAPLRESQFQLPIQPRPHLINAPALFRLSRTPPVRRIEHQPIAFFQRRNLVRLRRLDHHRNRG